VPFDASSGRLVEVLAWSVGYAPFQGPEEAPHYVRLAQYSLRKTGPTSVVSTRRRDGPRGRPTAVFLGFNLTLTRYFSAALRLPDAFWTSRSSRIR